jgi:hypothetical protein
MRLVALLLVAACGDDPVHALPDAPCVPQLSDYSIVVSGPTQYACHDPFKTEVVLTNNSCAKFTATTVKLHTDVLNGNCTPAGDFTYMQPAVVAAHSSGDLLNFTGNKFCCFQSACPTPMQCDELNTYTVATPAGDITGTYMEHQSLDGCDEICP